MDQQHRPDPQRWLEWMRGVGNPFNIIRGNLGQSGLSPVDAAVATVVAAILENYPFSNDEIDVSSVPADSPWMPLIESLWAKPPGFRARVWDAAKGDLDARFRQSVEGCQIAFRHYGPLHPNMSP